MPTRCTEKSDTTSSSSARVPRVVSCALECFDIQLDTVVFEADERPGGQLVEIPHSVRNVASGSFRDGSALRDSLEESAAILGDRLRLSQSVTRADLGERWIEVDAARIRGRALVIATGTMLPAAAGRGGRRLRR